jgi:hypothetical protein
MKKTKSFDDKAIAQAAVSAGKEWHRNRYYDLHKAAFVAGALWAKEHLAKAKQKGEE